MPSTAGSITSDFGLESELTTLNPACAAVVAQTAGPGHDWTGGAPEGLLGAGFQSARARRLSAAAYRPQGGPAVPAPPAADRGAEPHRASLAGGIGLDGFWWEES